MAIAAPPAANDLAAAAPVAQGATTQHLRGSSLMLIGRLLGAAASFSIQIFTVRYFSKGDYGAFAFALSLAALATNIAVFGLDKSIVRFVPIYQERRDYSRLFGTILLMVGTILGVGTALIVLVFALHGWIGRGFITDPRAVMLLLFLIALAPLDALDSLTISLFAVFAPPRASFFPKYLLGPALQLLVVMLLFVQHRSVYFLGAGYLIASLITLTANVIVLLRILRSQGWLAHFEMRALQFPAREIFGFTIPLFSSNLVFILRSSMVIALLGHFCGTLEVAAFRAVLPVANLNTIVFESFMFLFTPVATRLFVRGDQAGLNHLYWQSAVWIAVITFPVFAFSFALARPLTVLFFGQRYAHSSVLMMVLALGYYFNAALGFNGLTLRVCARVRYLAISDIVTSLASLALSLLLIPRYGALGAAIATSGTLALQNVLYQAGLRFDTGVRLLDWHYLRVYAAITLGIVILLLLQWLLAPPLYVSVPVALLASLLMVVVNRRLLAIEQTFPELRRFALARRFVGG